MYTNLLLFKPWQKLHGEKTRRGLKKPGILIVASNWGNGKMSNSLYENDFWYVGSSTLSIGNALSRFEHAFLTGEPRQCKAAGKCRSIIDELSLSPEKTLDSLYFTYADVPGQTAKSLNHDAIKIINHYEMLKNDIIMGNTRRHVTK